jgi:hypothetical protein
MAEADSPSYFNLVEAAAVLDMVVSLLRSPHVTVGPGDIGVIAGFRRQVG